ncbi:hypothetical protein [Maribacter aestuarii]|uniref:hypothetical protein n=1 Tax=Maribacter aestuarii TaxID=1130723 RepID=UPI0025A61EE9|nr:hypothetical protein [Maribacter aestuarii]
MFLFPLVGMGLFLVLYLLAALNYPGGSWAFPKREGFSFRHNYLCDLMDNYAINGEVNSARPYAILALALLCIALFWLWRNLPMLFREYNFNQKVMKTSGFISLLTLVFLAIGNHDKIVRIAGFFGVIAFVTCFIELFKTGHKNLFVFGILCLLVFLINFYIYETGLFLETLPVIQKITFLMFISWFIFLDVTLYRKATLAF